MAGACIWRLGQEPGPLRVSLRGERRATFAERPDNEHRAAPLVFITVSLVMARACIRLRISQ
jgi:hypothetical protein